MVHGNVPFALADQLSPFFKEIFPDSQIAAGYASKRTKTTCIVNGALKGYFRSQLVEEMRMKPYSLAIDGSNDTGLKKMNPLTVRIFTPHGVSTQLLDMCMTRGSAAADIFGKMDETLQQYGISWNNCVSVGEDNTSVNLGRRNSIMTRLTEKNPAVFFNGCPCHIVHNIASKAGDMYSRVTGFDVEDFCVDVYYWFDKSTKRKQYLEEFCLFCDTTYAHMIEHVSTRWLSLESAVSRVLQKYAALKSYFLSSDDSTARFRRLQQLFEDPMTEVHLSFYQAVLQQFVNVNKFIQLENPLIPVLHDVLHDFLKKLCCRFLNVRRVKEVGVELIDYNDDLAKVTNTGLDIGFTTRTELQKLIEDGYDMNIIERFYHGVRSFYGEALDYARSHLPLNDPVLENARFLNFALRESSELSQLEYFIDRYSSLLPHKSDPAKMEKLKDEFISYQLLDDSDVPPGVWERATVYEDCASGKPTLHSMDVVWGHLAMRTTADGRLQFLHLSQVAQLVLTIPHSNAAEERVFSIVRKNKTSFRPNLDPEETLGSIVTTKMALPKDTPPYKFEPPKDLLLAAKRATKDYNCSHSSRHN